MTDSNYQDNSLEDWHRQQEEIERTNAMIEEPKKILTTVGELRAALAPFGEETKIFFNQMLPDDPGDLLWAHRIVIEGDYVIVELLPFFEPEDE